MYSSSGGRQWSSSHHAAARCITGRQAGFSLIELLVAITIALFVVGGLAALFVSMKLSFLSQDKFAQLEEGERLASTMLSQTVRAAGYFPSPDTLTSSSAFPSVTGDFGTMAAGQSIAGSTGDNGEVLSVRFMSASGDGLMNCLGQVNTSGSNQVQLNSFLVKSGSNVLSCSVDGGTTYTEIVGGVASMSVRYGVDTTGGTGSILGPNQYLSADDVTKQKLWNSVYSVKVTLQFVNPQASPATLPWVLAIDLMAKA